nr:uncharacterized protein LOC121129054 [Lepeophtheirus salmonis]
MSDISVYFRWIEDWIPNCLEILIYFFNPNCCPNKLISEIIPCQVDPHLSIGDAIWTPLTRNWVECVFSKLILNHTYQGVFLFGEAHPHGARPHFLPRANTSSSSLWICFESLSMLSI